MDERSNVEKMDEIMLPGFRFHPTDEELVGFYLKRKIQHLPLSIELIKQLDIYKFDPWDLPKLAATGEKEWYFYCPRDRKYRNSARPNRVTGAGFWKATGTDRPIYSSSHGSNSTCIGLKKSLVFYKGRAAKGIKTDWMMHEFRLPSLTTDSLHPKRFMDKNIPANDSWAICRIFKKANSTAQRAPSHSWVTQISPQTTNSDMLKQHIHAHSSTEQLTSFIQYGISSNDLQLPPLTSFSPLDNIPPYKTFSQMASKQSQVPISNGDLFLPHEISHDPSECNVDASSLLLNMSSSIFGDFGMASGDEINFNGMQKQYLNNGYSITLPQEIQENFGQGEDTALVKDPNAPHFDDQWGIFCLPLSMNDADAWKLNLLCDSSPCPSEMSASYSTNKGYS